MGKKKYYIIKGKICVKWMKKMVKEKIIEKIGIKLFEKTKVGSYK